jgi:C-lobe and N-lobe beta barrels of Tf-binding protein B
VRNSFNFLLLSLGGQSYEQIENTLERGAFAYGDLTSTSNVPKTGSGAYKGSMLATLVFNPTMDGQDPSTSTVLSSYFQWMEGTSNINVDFLNNTFQLALAGKVLAPQFDRFTSPQQAVLATGATFAASGKGTINLVNFGGFKGQFDSAKFTNPDGSQRSIAVAGSSIDGAFYGPTANEVGGGFRVVGGNPDERVDVLGAFVGVK